jgi:hypothetical protein
MDAMGLWAERRKPLNRVFLDLIFGRTGPERLVSSLSYKALIVNMFEMCLAGRQPWQAGRPRFPFPFGLTFRKTQSPSFQKSEFMRVHANLSEFKRFLAVVIAMIGVLLGLFDAT